ncbi:hypothetical protein FRX31_019910, partial [Thalictrum thalictroides]
FVQSIDIRIDANPLVTLMTKLSKLLIQSTLSDFSNDLLSTPKLERDTHQKYN